MSSGLTVEPNSSSSSCGLGDPNLLTMIPTPPSDITALLTEANDKLQALKALYNAPQTDMLSCKVSEKSKEIAPLCVLLLHRIIHRDF